MTFPMWFAVPPEVPSAWLSTGMGPGPLLAAARAWHALAAQYTEIATELASVLAAVQASSWQGPSADRFVVAHQPFRYWLTHAATVATAAAAAHETAAAGYTSALGGMPTLAELAATGFTSRASSAVGFCALPISSARGSWPPSVARLTCCRSSW